MTLPVTNVGDNTWTPGVAAYGYLPDQLIAGHHNLVTQPIVLGVGTLPRGTILGQQTTFSAVSAAVAGNTGNGTIGAISPGTVPEVSQGSAPLPPYVIRATAPTSFSVTDPEGNLLANATVGTPYTSAEVNFTITAGGTAFVAGDTFNVTFLPGTGTYVACVRTASDGSQVPSAILADNSDASLGPVRAGAYVAGEFNVNAISIDASWTAPAIVAALRGVGIFLKTPISAADPT